jgi:hypothetical protein
MQATPSTKERHMTAAVTNEKVREWDQSTAPYTIMILRRTDAFAAAADRDETVWAHARRMISLHYDGIMPIVCPCRDDRDDSDISGVGIFAADPDRTARIMDEDPAVQAGLYAYEVHPCRSVPGSALRPR